MSKDQDFISFPPAYLGRDPIKFPLLANDERLIAINKPAGMSCFQHEWTLGRPDISMALRRELLAEKPQLKRLGIEGVFRVFNLDAEVSGVLVYAKTEENEGLLKNASGSSQILYRYHLLVKGGSERREFACDLPLAKHFSEKRVLVSHKTGKKCESRFRFLRPFGQYELWEAETVENRLHQIRVHAAENGLEIVGEEMYADGGQIYLSRLKRGYLPSREREFPIYPHLCLHLVEVEFRLPEVEIAPISSPLPGKFATLLKRLDAHRGGRG